MEYKRHPERLALHFIAGPIIYALAIPLVIVDISLEIYHRVCFPLYGMPYVPRGQYFRFDRAKLPYLTLWEKLNCQYCSYANGLLLYASVIAGETEQYWCGIRNKKEPGFVEPRHHDTFLRYGDKKEFTSFLEKKTASGIKKGSRRQ
ncbi:hypothetical protein HYV71_05055 [Candidatus Uhrbacteria bacterium]|nr:hypothetical protein [Candidatus Uhrbacteria bacterium]